VLAIALAFVTVYVLTANRISDQRAKIGTLQAQASQAQSSAAHLAPYVQFAKLAQARAVTIRQIASTRFDWQAALGGLSRVVPANTSLQSLTGGLAGANVGGTTIAPAAPASGALTASVPGPSIALSGCSDSQDDVARLMSRLRLINGVTLVSLQTSAKSANAQSGAAVSSAGGTGGGCPAGSPAFALNIAFAAPASTAAAAPAGPQAVSSTTTTGGSR
jgi:Tfp pilus assembly protein PilN